MSSNQTGIIWLRVFFATIVTTLTIIGARTVVEYFAEHIRWIE